MRPTAVSQNEQQKKTKTDLDQSQWFVGGFVQRLSLLNLILDNSRELDGL